jgi:hypothetical protein
VSNWAWSREEIQHRGADEAHLIVFDRRPDSPWDDRIWQREATEQGWTLGVWGA